MGFLSPMAAAQAVAAVLKYFLTTQRFYYIFPVYSRSAEQRDTI